MAQRLLLADDSPTIAKILTMALQSEPYEIVTVLNEKDAKRELETNPPFFFLVDLSLPGTDGYEFSTWVKQNSKLRNIKVVLLASAFEPIDQEKYKKCKADGIIQKPFDPSELRRVLRKIMEAPPVFIGVNVEGSLSGVRVVKEDPKPAQQENADVDLSSLLGDRSQTSLSADDILATPEAPVAASQEQNNELSGSIAPPPFGHTNDNPEEFITEFSDRTVIVNLDEETIDAAPKFQDERVLDLSKSSPHGSSGDNIQPLHTKSLTIEQPSLKPPSTSLTEEQKTDALEHDLSENAQALAAFFDAEIQQNATGGTKETVAEKKLDNFDQSIDSIDWGSEQPNLSQWTSHAPETENPSLDSPPPFTHKEHTSPAIDPSGLLAHEILENKSQPPKKTARSTSKSSPSDFVGSFLFDTGNSNFRFADDYIERITKSFTGHEGEYVPSQEQLHHSEEPVFKNKGSDTKEQPKLGGGAWTSAELEKMEAVIRQEVQTAVREVLEKVAWEIIPDLAENIIKTELEKVMKDMEN